MVVRIKWCNTWIWCCSRLSLARIKTSTTRRSACSIMMCRRIGVDHSMGMFLSCVNLSQGIVKKSVQSSINALDVITELKIFTILRNTRPNFVHPTPTNSTSVNMATSVLLRTASTSYRLPSWKRWRKMPIFICFILKRFGVPTAIKNTNVTPVSTPTTGKTIDAHLHTTSIHSCSALAGKWKRTSRLTRMVATWSIDAASATDGKS